ncbi:hypothetical protein KFE25_008342 [Diacronema lutheri]|uniref:Sulfate exporter family transporter n=1 Tax=Diacronema lutheri TaxID=2081491 RepID=A0A8J5XLF1_DIALT|nr:hypothetical protein KFE25_008342 [Diacronema lutheri]
MLRAVRTLAPGLAASAGVASGAALVASQLPETWHVSAIPVSIVLGAAAANGPLKAHAALLKPGVGAATSTVLRAGVICAGAKLSAMQVLWLGWATVPAAATAVTVGMVAIPRLAAWAGLAPRLGALIASGTSVCGVTAISAVGPAIGASQAEVAIAVANVVAFGSLAMLLHPHVAHRVLPADDSASIGLFLGLAVHDTAQVMGSAAAYAEQYADTAVVSAAAVAKLTRNLALAAVVPLMAARHAPGAAAGKGLSAGTLAKAVPTFVLGFVMMALARSAGDAQLAAGGKAAGLLGRDAWAQCTELVGGVLSTKLLLPWAMAAVGLSVNVGAFAGVGWAPFAVGAAGAALVGSSGLAAAVCASRVRAASGNAARARAIERAPEPTLTAVRAAAAAPAA